MNRGQVLAADFEKRELKGTQQNSDNDKQSCCINKTDICNDAVTFFQTAKSGGFTAGMLKGALAEGGEKQ